jgi:hypothetical protein
MPNEITETTKVSPEAQTKDIDDRFMDALEETSDADSLFMDALKDESKSDDVFMDSLKQEVPMTKEKQNEIKKETRTINESEIEKTPESKSLDDNSRFKENHGPNNHSFSTESLIPKTGREWDIFKASELIKNKEDGLRRENEVEEDLKKRYPEEEGYTILSERVLYDKNGNIVKDPETGEARRIDFVVVKDGKVVDSIEVTSKTADKTDQAAKEQRIREAGGNYIKDSNGNLVEIPPDVQTRIERRD